MSHTALDLSFARQGRSLSEWLWDLVADDRPTRQQAAEAVGGIWRGYPSYSSAYVLLEDEDVQILEHRADDFGAAVRAAVSAPGFTDRGAKN